MDQYIVLGRIGEGAHGVVFKAKDRETGEMVALKKVPLRRPEEGVPPQTLREIKALREIEDHPHDLKPANLLLDGMGRLKLADFGLARVLATPQGRPYSHQVATRWYRAPELLYGARHYDEGVDLWAVGCIFGELLNLSPLFPGENDIEQLCCVLRALGTPSPRAWPELSELPDYPKIRFRRQDPAPLEQLVPEAEPAARDLLRRFLRYPSRQRIRAHQALLHPYFFGPLELTPPPPQGGSRPPPDFNLDTPLLPALPPPGALAPPAPGDPR
ncbi:cyclin-dependent kinase 20 isoform X2 [Haliaeetus albicilla]|uniref:cyclin-dependent kinase 20 isoform X2 n=1 Tax=Haliaeetus albicilla TaxID=8969 RepID=UPI0037E92045